MHKPPKKRTEKEIQALVPLIKDIQFFKEREIREQDLYDIVKFLTYEYKNTTQKVFDFGKYLSSTFHFWILKVIV